MIERQGKQFVLYAGLLDEAHRNGLKAIRTQLVQAPSPDNGNVCICYAEVETEKGVFSGIGDASADNVGRNIAVHAIRMAETRAKARALRDAINVGAVAVEELGELEDGPSAPMREEPRPAAAARLAPQPAASPTPIRRAAAPAAVATNGAAEPATP